MIDVNVNYSLQSEVAEMKEKSRMAGGRYIQNQQLEEIRNCQEQLDKQQKQWAIDLRKQKEEANAEEQRMKDERVRIKNYVKKLIFIRIKNAN